MKNQYFGDRRDVFKYDLPRFLCRDMGSERALTFIPMLTPSDGRGTGNLISNGPDRWDERIYRFLRGCLHRGERDVRKLRDLFPSLGVRYSPYRDAQYFTHERRAEYFAGIADEQLRGTVVFRDQDTGIKVGIG